MNSKVKELASAFSTYARHLLQEQEVQLKRVKDDHVLSGKLARIRMFNEHLEILKEKLESHIKSTLEASTGLSSDQYSKLDKALQHIYAECVNDYMCISFIKENE